MKICYLLVLVLFSFTGSIKSQTDSPDTEVSLNKLFKRLHSVPGNYDRIRINDSIITLVDKYVASDSVFTHRFERLRYLGQITSPDSLIKIITWNLILSNDSSSYICYFILKPETGQTNIVKRLAGMYREQSVRCDTLVNEKDWYGALYYDIRPSPERNDRAWVLLGIDYGNSLITRKIIEVVSFDPDNRVIFGKKWFMSEDKTEYRVVMEYRSTAVMTLRFLNDSSIVFDHLVPVSPEFTGNRQYYAPDYSYDTFSFENGSWKLSVNVDVRNKE